MSAPTKLVFFGNEFPNDDLKALFRGLHRHGKDRRFRQLATFLEESTRVLQNEVAQLPEPLKKLVPHFENLMPLTEVDFRQGPLGAAMESALLTILELGMFIGHYEAEERVWDLSADRTTLAGLSIGLLAAAGVALSTHLAEVVQNGAECVRVSFRLGVYVHDISRKLEAPQADGSLLSWAHVVTGETASDLQEELSRYNTETGTPELLKVFISAADKTSVSVSGPPSRIRAAFRASQRLRYSKSLALPVYDGLCHAAHLYDEETIHRVLHPDGSVIPTSRPVQLALLSSRSGQPFEATTAAELFRAISTELLTGTIFLDNITAGILDRTERCADATQCQIETYRTSLVFKGLLKALEACFPDRTISTTDLIPWVFQDYGARQPKSCADSKLAIVGMACRMPGGANDLDLFWELLAQGRDTHTTVPADRFDLETHYDPTGETENATRTPFGNFIDQPGLFDAGFFNMSPREAEQTDPMHRLALVTAYEALEMAGIVSGRTPSSNPKRIATFYGQASDDWRELNASQNIGTYAVPGGERAFANGRINYFFKFGGPSFNLDTACSSGLAAVQAACSALWAGEADTVLAGGLNIITDPDNYAGLGNGHFLSRTGQCKVWDQSADGYCRADGVGSVVIKRLEDAEADNDNILAVVLSAATNHSAEAISITHPHAGAQKENYTQVLHQAAVNPLDISYVELHGTGTQAGDAQEAESVLDIFAPRTHRRRADQPLHLGAVKSNIGHGEAAAGIASLLKVLLMYQKNEIPAHIGIPTVINPAIPTDLEQRQVYLPRTKTAWPRAAGQIRRAIVNSFGAHGGNTTLVLEDAPEKQVTVAREERSTHPVVISAKSKKSLAANLETLLAYLDENPETDLGDLSYTTCARRMHHSWRLATAVSDIPALQKFLRNAVSNDAVSQTRPIPTEAPPVVFTFTGQGAYYAGLAQGLFQALPFFRAEVRQLDHLSQRLGFPSIVPVILGEVEEGTATALVTQLSIVIVEIALARLWLLLLGIPAPHAVIGHSLGEYAALAVAGVLSTADALYLVGHRAQLIEEHCTPGSHAMLSVRATIADIERLVGTGSDAPTYELSCQNTHQDTVIGGSIQDLNAIREKLEPEGIKCVNVDVPFAFHTAQMDAVRERLAKAVAAVPFKTPSVPVLSPLLGSVVFDGKSINPEYIVRATREPVQFATAIDAAQELGIVNSQTLWVDIGPHPICASFVRSLVPGARIVSSCRRNEDNFATMAKSLCTLHLAGRTPSWAEYFRPDEQAYSLLRLPKYRWNEVNYWIQYLGTWTLDKAHLKNGGSQKRAITDVPSVSSLRTSLIHQVTEETVDKTTATLKAISDIQHPDFLEAVHGHTMNNCGVATSSIWTDMAMTVGEHLYRRLVPGTDHVLMDLCDFEVQHAQVANTNSNTPQPLALEAHLDLPTRHMSLAWYDVNATTNQRADAPFATGSIKYPADPTGAAWSIEWSRVTHLIQGRIEALQHLATENKASTLSKPLAYALFKNVVDYAPRYRGMDRVVIHDHEAFSDITLTTDRHGTWHTPPHWIDSVSHLAGLVMNGSDASNTRDFFYVTPGCGSCRMTEPLIAGGKYRNYVRMFPMPDEAHMYAGDLYILREDKIIGVVEQLKFRRVPRLLMDRFFSPNKNAAAHAAPAPTPAPAATPAVKKQPPTETIQPQASKTEQKQDQLQLPNLASAAPSTASSSSSPSSSGVATPTTEQEAPVADASAVTGVAGKCLELIANETGLGVAELTADATFVQLGVDSLMSLVLSEKLRSEMGLEIKSSLFLECPTVGDLTGWLEQYC